MVSYGGRPGGSPFLAALVANATIRSGDRVLDLGCGDGSDALALVEWGVRRVVGVDSDKRAIATARRRAARLELAAEFRVGSAMALRDEGGFDVVVDTLLGNNLRDADMEPYAASVARALRPGGLLVMQWRVTRAAHRLGHDFPREVTKRFALGPAVSALLPEKALGAHPPYARVSVALGRKR